MKYVTRNFISELYLLTNCKLHAKYFCYASIFRLGLSQLRILSVEWQQSEVSHWKSGSAMLRRWFYCWQLRLFARAFTINWMPTGADATCEAIGALSYDCVCDSDDCTVNNPISFCCPSRGKRFYSCIYVVKITFYALLCNLKWFCKIGSGMKL